MSKWINADALIKKFGELTVMLWLDSVEEAEIVSLIGNAPSIDIVRCGECKHGTYCEEADMYICNANDQDLYEAEHFCSYGERRES